MTSAIEQHTVFPPVEGEAVASVLHALRELHNRGFASAETPATAVLLGPTGERVELPAELFEVLQQVAAAMEQGLAINIVPRHTELTTQEAADMLNVSRPTLVKLLEEGKIPFSKPGRHRRVRLDHLVQYQEQTRRRRKALLDAMTAEASEQEDSSADNVDRFVPTR